MIEPLPDVIADAGLIRQVWSNLLSNALKFTARREVPLVQVGAETTDTNVVFNVQDNGVGFDPAKVKRLFTMFQRLHANNDFAGTGVGLATAAAVVRRHGGSISAKTGGVARGATVHVMLPRVRLVT